MLRTASIDMRWLEQDSIGPEHVLLGLIRATDTLGARVIDELKIDTDGLRAQALRALGVAWASELSPSEEKLSRREQQLREAERRCRDAGTEEERQERERQRNRVSVAERTSHAHENSQRNRSGRCCQRGAKRPQNRRA
ncbi:MAG: Clp protease N-terminal domain-containing protein, partial [Solirubrobacteraceae bacterium]